MDSRQISKPYAEALVLLGEEKGTLDQLHEEMNAFFEVFLKEAKFQIFLEAPHISVNEKKKVLQAVFTSKLSPVFLHFLCLVAEKRRFLIFREIVEEFYSLMDKKEGRIRAKVITAREISPELAGKIAQILEKKTQRKIAVEYKVNPDLIGGIVLKVGETQIDGSLRHGLQNWKKLLMEKKYEV